MGVCSAAALADTACARAGNSRRVVGWEHPSMVIASMGRSPRSVRLSSINGLQPGGIRIDTAKDMIRYEMIKHERDRQYQSMDSPMPGRFIDSPILLLLFTRVVPFSIPRLAINSSLCNYWLWTVPSDEYSLESEYRTSRVRLGAIRCRFLTLAGLEMADSTDTWNTVRLSTVGTNLMGSWKITTALQSLFCPTHIRRYKVCAVPVINDDVTGREYRWCCHMSLLISSRRSHVRGRSHELMMVRRRRDTSMGWSRQLE